jgi:hypothetical protein
VIFLVNFVNHIYQYQARSSCGLCSEEYSKCKDSMVRFLKEFLVKNQIGIALEEGGNPYQGGIRKAQEIHGFEKTILQETIHNINHNTVTHGFVDITKEQVNELVEAEIIHDVSELKKRPQLRDEYIAQAASDIFSKSRDKNGLLLVANQHFGGVKKHFEKTGLPVKSDTVQKYAWYKDADEIELTHIKEEHDS